jgi:hypothetical protein
VHLAAQFGLQFGLTNKKWDYIWQNNPELSGFSFCTICEGISSKSLGICNLNNQSLIIPFLNHLVVKAFSNEMAPKDPYF